MFKKFTYQVFSQLTKKTVNGSRKQFFQQQPQNKNRFSNHTNNNNSNANQFGQYGLLFAAAIGGSAFTYGMLEGGFFKVDAKVQQQEEQNSSVKNGSSTKSILSNGQTTTTSSENVSPLRKAGSLLDSIGNTPLIELKKLNKNPLAKVYVKVEYTNPSGSIKDRIAKHIIETMENQGKLKKGGVIVENSSGNTAAGVAMIAALKGYPAILVVPNKCSSEKVAALKAFGANVIVCPPNVSSGDADHYENVAIRLENEIPSAIRLNQYNNQLNVEAHYLSTGPEIWKQTNQDVDVFICGASTGGTISGVGRYLKEASSGHTRVLVADPAGSALLNRVRYGKFESSPGSTQIEGIGKSYKVDCTHFEVIDDAIPVGDKDAFETSRRMAQEEGLLCGISSGANVHAALEYAKHVTEPTTIVTILPDGGQKYFSKIYNPEWLHEKELISNEKKQQMSKTSTVEVIPRLVEQYSN